jgi:uncharacterized protein
MQSLGSVLNNHVLIVSLLSCVLAQVSKVVVELIQHGKWNYHVIFESGGMPSSHSALVTALATDIGLRKGLESGEFAIATVFAIIVMYDAAAAGKQAKILNQIIDELFTGDHHLTEIHLKELLGHTPFQVLIGSIMGVVIACISELGGRG